MRHEEAEGVAESFREDRDRAQEAMEEAKAARDEAERQLRLLDFVLPVLDEHPHLTVGEACDRLGLTFYEDERGGCRIDRTC